MTDDVLLEALRDAGLAGLTFERSTPFGVLVRRHGVALEVWSAHQGQFLYRSLANWSPVETALSMPDVIDATTRLCHRDRRGRCHD